MSRHRFGLRRPGRGLRLCSTVPLVVLDARGVVVESGRHYAGYRKVAVGCALAAGAQVIRLRRGPISYSSTFTGRGPCVVFIGMPWQTTRQLLAEVA